MKSADIDTKVWARLTARDARGVERRIPLADGSVNESSPTRSRFRYLLLFLLAVAFGLGLIAGSISSLSLLQSPKDESEDMTDLARRDFVHRVPDTQPETAVDTTEPPRDPAQTILATLEEWTQAWSGKNVARYLDCYSERFEPSSGQALEAWKAQRRERLTRPGEIDIEISDVEIEPLTPDRVKVKFDQAFASPTYRDRVMKTLELVKEDPLWKILREEAQSPPPSK